jgi:glucuronokinase
MIETYAYARAGLLGNPSDGYFGKTLGYLFRDFRARVLIYPSARLEIRLSKADTPVFDNLDDLYQITRWRGYYGGVRILQALLVRLSDYCREQGIELPDRNFTIEYETTVPLRLGLGGSSCIITAALRALMAYYQLEIPKPVQANLVLETETKELGVSAGLQDRVIQVYEGLVYMDFDRQHMAEHGHGRYEPVDLNLLPPVYVAYRRSLSEGTEVFHNDIRARWNAGDPEVHEAMAEWASYAERGKAALERGDVGEVNRLVNANFDLRARLYRLSPGNLEMVRLARECGASANFAGSGGAITGLYPDESVFEKMREHLGARGIEVIRPKLR